MHKEGFRFRLYRDDLPGHPDIVLPKFKTIIFINGCFWHHHANCKRATIPKSNKKYWTHKLDENKKRDFRNRLSLKRLGWKVYVIWECQLKKEKLPKTLSKLHNYLLD